MWNRIIKNTLWLTAGEAIGRLIRLSIVIYAARVLGAANWGILSYALSLAMLLTVAADMGLGAVITRELVRYPAEKGRYLSTSFFIKIFFVAIASLIVLSLGSSFTKFEISRTMIVFTALLVIFDNLRLYAYAITRAAEKMHLESLTTILTQVAIVAFGFFALWKTHSAEYLIAAYAAGSAVGALAIFTILGKQLREIFTAFDKSLIKKIVGAAWPFALLGLLGTIMLNTDIIMLSWFTTATNVGYYSAGQKIILTFYLIPGLISTAAFPNLARLAYKDKAAFAGVLVKTLKTAFLIAVPLTVGGLITAANVITVIYGKEYLAGTLSFQILLVSLLINFPSTILGNALFAYDLQKEFLKYAGLGAGLNALFNLLFIPYWGISGASVATLITQIASNFFFWYKVQKVNPFKLTGVFGKLVVAGLALGISTTALQYLNVNFFIIAPIVTVIYLTTLYLLKEEILGNVVDLVKSRLIHETK